VTPQTLYQVRARVGMKMHARYTKDGRVDDPKGHRHYDRFSSELEPGTIFASRSHCKKAWHARRRRNMDFACSAHYDFDPVGETRERYYEQKLLLGLAWHLERSEPDTKSGDDGSKVATWKLRSLPLDASQTVDGVQIGVQIASEELEVGESCQNNFELICSDLEQRYSLQCGCPCCARKPGGTKCKSCEHAFSWHMCVAQGGKYCWRPGTLFDGALDVEGALLRAEKRGVNLDKLRAKAAEFVEAGAMTKEHATTVLRQIEVNQGILGEMADNDTATESGHAAAVLQQAPQTEEQVKQKLEGILKEMMENMEKVKHGNGPSDQWAVFEHAVRCLEDGKWLRLIVQASAGTGKSYVLIALCVYCLVHGLKFNAGAPTGIAAANLEAEGTDISASTLHKLFGLNFDVGSKLNFEDRQDPGVAKLLGMDVLLIDEASMIDRSFWDNIADVLSRMPMSARGRESAREAPDDYGRVHIIMFLDFKQLPPATNEPTFLVRGDVRESFRFMTLNENRRVIDGGSERADDLNDYHQVLTDVSLGQATSRVRDFFVRKFSEGALTIAKKEPFEGSTSIFAKRRYRDGWNRTVIQRLARESGHKLNIRAKCRPKNTKGRLPSEQKWCSLTSPVGRSCPCACVCACACVRVGG
jgi:hypothetical protein